ncbi:hypothetical protein DPSP01_008108 [Paraphaeosphaeria sporulosa]|uniref:Uncharacterized protein n=1 Tax=Paraphaeosphaeria sporulosa TaxID=1460663 RepID=A0A177CQ84_9PLEO|nr:uncharacterized protein CC84DRAFT_1204153 [Paraphaeosphaeria sporulosa]OAG08939.1 hypothetical protein CC84DRAFT_1204153 [Paraphaeosphaeria sporulosa]
MDYYQCTKSDLHQELTRRGLQAYGDQDEAAERLKQDDHQRGTVATEIDATIGLSNTVYTWRLSNEYGKTVVASMLVGESIVHWTMNQFFPAVQLFFESGLSCWIEGSQLPGACIGLDSALRFRLTDIAHAEDGCLINTILSKRDSASDPSIRILEATVANRKSIAVKETHQFVEARPVTTIAQEQHIVVGLRLEGMESMGYVWARLPSTTVGVASRMWGHVRIAGMRIDIPVPFVRFPQTGIKPGAQSKVVLKESVIDPKLRGHPTI